MGRPKGSKNGIRRLIEKTCETCSRVFQVEPYQTSARFCSRPCQAVGHSKEMIKPQDRRCEFCHKHFVVAPSNVKKYCSRECASKAHGAKVSGTRPSTVYVSKICSVCNSSFSARATLRQTFCSRVCANISYQRRITLSCQICHKSFTVRAKRANQKYCSRACRTIGIGKTESYIEKAFAIALTSIEVSCCSQYSLGPYTIDFAIPEMQIAIECDGDYWHSQPASILRDKRKDRYLLNRGWRVLHFSETEINIDIDRCLSLVMQTLSQ
jgi:very-short-patch-repair endonuclease